MYRDDLEAHRARSRELEAELERLKAEKATDQEKLTRLQSELSIARHAMERWHQQPMAPLPPPPPPLEPYLPSNATTVLIMGIISISVCGLAGPFAWKMGNDELARIDMDLADPNKRGEATAGRMLGIVSTIFTGFGLLVMLFVLLAG